MPSSSLPHVRVRQFITGLALVLAAFPSVLAGVTEVWWNITYVDNVNPDGLLPRRAVGVNGTWPYVIYPSMSNLNQMLTTCANVQTAADRSKCRRHFATACSQWLG